MFKITPLAIAKFLMFQLILLVISLPLFAQSYTISRVIDAATIELTDGEVVRLIGVDCPAIEEKGSSQRDDEKLNIHDERHSKYAQKAKDFVSYHTGQHKLSAFMKDNWSEILIRFDSKESVNHRDKEGRLLAYVYVPAIVKEPVLGQAYFPGIMIGWAGQRDKAVGHVGRGLFLNASLIRAGMCRTDRNVTFEQKADFLKYEQEAKEDEVNLWASGYERRLKEAIENLKRKYNSTDLPLPTEHDLNTSKYGTGLPEDMKVFQLAVGNIDIEGIQLARFTKKSKSSHIDQMITDNGFGMGAIWEELILFAKDKDGVYAFDNTTTHWRTIVHIKPWEKILRRWPNLIEWINDVPLKSSGRATGKKS